MWITDWSTGRLNVSHYFHLNPALSQHTNSCNSHSGGRKCQVCKTVCETDAWWRPSEHDSSLTKMEAMWVSIINWTLVEFWWKLHTMLLHCDCMKIQIALRKGKTNKQTKKALNVQQIKLHLMPLKANKWNHHVIECLIIQQLSLNTVEQDVEK